MENIVDTEAKSLRNKRKKFEDIAIRRVNRVIKEIRLIGNLSNRSSYEYTEEDVKKIVKALQREVDAVKARFEGPGKGTDPVFSL
jgi:ABC-type Fe3+-hydroxamate transport system substrate-binding protein